MPSRDVKPLTLEAGHEDHNSRLFDHGSTVTSYETMSDDDGNSSRKQEGEEEEEYFVDGNGDRAAYVPALDLTRWENVGLAASYLTVGCCEGACRKVHAYVMEGKAFGIFGKHVLLSHSQAPFFFLLFCLQV